MDLKWSKLIQNGPKWSPSPSPSLASAKVSCQGAKHIEKIIYLMIFYDFYEKIKIIPCQGAYQIRKLIICFKIMILSSKIRKLTAEMSNKGSGLRWRDPGTRFRSPGPICAPVPGGPWAQYINRSAPCLPARQVRVSGVWGSRLFFSCLPGVCFWRMLDARGNLDLESPEELLTSSGTPGPRPLRAHSFLALNFCIIFREVFLYSFFMYF